MKKIILGLMLLSGTASAVFSGTDVPMQKVKLGEIVNGETKLTYDSQKLKNAMSKMVENENLEVGETALFMEDGKYYLWGSIVDKTTKLATGKLVFSIEKEVDNSLQLMARPVYSWRCVSVNGSCVVCSVMASSCYCSAFSTPAGGQCEWKKVIIGDDGRVSLFDITFQELLKKQG